MVTLLQSRTEDDAQEDLHIRGRTDGLPVIVPTPGRVERTLAYAAGLLPDDVLGTLAPSGKAITVRAAAINAVMAGCPPEMFPVVIAACSALGDPTFEVGPMQGTTHCVTPFVIVNGPARDMFGFSSGVGVLGPGSRANATLGRMLRLVLINVGGGIPGIGDMASIGTPAKFTCCIAEAEEVSPFEPLHVALGNQAQDSTVTLLGVEAPHSLYYGFDDRATAADFLLRRLGAGLATPAANSIWFGKGVVSIMLNPLHAKLLADQGWNRREIQHRLFEYSAMSRSALVDVGGFGGDLDGQSGDTFRVVPRPENFLIVVAGDDGGAYSAFMPSWCGGSDGQHPVTRRIVLDESCEVALSQRG